MQGQSNEDLNELKKLTGALLQNTIPEKNNYQKIEGKDQELKERIRKAREDAKNNYQPHKTAESVKHAMDEAEKQVKEEAERETNKSNPQRTVLNLFANKKDHSAPATEKAPKAEETLKKVRGLRQ